MRAATLSFLLLVCLLFAAPARALEQRLTAADLAERDYFGSSVAVDGDTAVVGALGETGTSPGLVYVFTRTGDSWTQTARLQATDSQVGDKFGHSVAVQGDTIVVGAPGHIVAGNNSAGAVYTFDRTGAANRTQTGKLTIAAPANVGGQLGWSVAIDGDVIAAGALADSSPGMLSHGAIYLFSRTGPANRTERARLLASDRGEGDLLGSSLAMDGDVVVAGAYRKQSTMQGPTFLRGAAYTFDSAATGAHTDTARLTPTDASGLDQFGFSVDIDGETIVVGANRDSFLGRNYVGSAYTFARTGTDRGQTGKLVSSDGVEADSFGWDVAVGGVTVAVGAPGEGTALEPRHGSVYTFARTSPDAERSELTKLFPVDSVRDDAFGHSVDMDGETIIVGAQTDDIGPTMNAGSATVYFAPATGAACSDGADNDGDGKIDFPADPGCSGPDDTGEGDAAPGATPTPTPTPTATPTATPPRPVGPAPTPPPTGSETPRILRPRTQPPVVVKARVLKLVTIWECRAEPDGRPCKGFTKVVIGRFEDELRATGSRAVTIGSGTATIASGARKPVTATLSKKGAKLLRRRGKLKTRAIVTLAREGAATARAVVPVTLKAPKPR